MPKTASQTALILIDFENEWQDKKSEYYVGDLSKVLSNTNQLIDFCRKKKYKIIWTTHVEKDSDGAFAKNTKNVEIIDSLHKQKSDVLIIKHKISPFFKTNLEQELKNIRKIIVCGILTNLCVRSLVQDAYDREFEIVVVKDCCAALDTETQDFTFRDLKATREEIEFIDVEELIR